jgi:hypothetical protein
MVDPMESGANAMTAEVGTEPFDEYDLTKEQQRGSPRK